MKKLVALVVLIPIVFLLSGCFKTISVTYTSPVNGATEVQINATIIWTAKNATLFDVYFGTDANPPLLSPNQTAMTYSPAMLNPGTTYCWKVVAKDGERQKEGPLWSFTTGSAPSDLNYTGPANNSTDRPLDTTLNWTCVGATSYDVYFGTDANPPLVSIGQAGSSYSPGPLAPGTTYHWKVIAKNAFGELAGATWKFTTGSAPSDLNYTGPANNSTDRPLDTTLNWTCVGATSYDVYFGTNATPPLVSIGQAGSSYSPGPLAPGTTYHWKVIAKNAFGELAGATWKFTTGSAPSDLNYTGPANNSTDRPLDTTLNWTCVGATSYDVYFGTDANPPLVSIGQAGSSYSPGPLAPGTTYHWKVIAKNAFGELAGATWKFTTMLVIPDGISISRVVLQKNSDEEIFVHGKNIDNIGGCSLILTYDSTYLEIDTNKGNNGVVALNSFNEGLIIVDATTAGTLRIDIAFMSAKNISDEDIFKIYVKTMNKTGDTQINITGQVLDPSTNPIAVDFTGNTITVE